MNRSFLINNLCLLLLLNWDALKLVMMKCDSSRGEMYFSSSNSEEWKTLSLEELEMGISKVETALYDFLETNNTDAFIF